MSAPSPRPALKRQSSKVRFSRCDMSPVGTMVSDNDGQGGSNLHQSGPIAPPTLHNPFREVDQDPYDIDSYPFGANTEIALSQSQDHGVTDSSGRYREIPNESFNPYEDAPEDRDPYTAAPPRMSSARRYPASVVNTTPTQVHRPTLDSLVPINDARYASAEISPRNTAGMDSYVMPPVHTSPAPRPASALRPSLVSNYQSPRQSVQHTAETEYAEYTQQNSPRARASIPASAPRRLAEQARQSIPQGCPREMGSPRSHQSPRPSEPFRPGPGYRRNEYEERTGLTPGPTYQRPSYFSQNHQEYDRYRPDDRQRYDSQATLTGDDYIEKYQHKKYSVDSQQPRRQRAMSDTSDSRDMRRRSTKELEDAETGTYTVKGGVFSQLLRLTGKSMRRRQSSRGIAASSRATSCVGEDLPTMKSLGLHKVGSTASTTFGAGELDNEDPRITGVKPQKMQHNRRASFSDMLFKRDAEDAGDGVFTGKRKRRASIQRHVAGKLNGLTPLVRADVQISSPGSNLS